MGVRNAEDELLLISAEVAAEEWQAKKAPATTSKVRFGAKASGLHDDRLSTKPAPSPKGPPTDQLIEDAKRRRRERAEEERNRRGR